MEERAGSTYLTRCWVSSLCECWLACWLLQDRIRGLWAVDANEAVLWKTVGETGVIRWGGGREGGEREEREREGVSVHSHWSSTWGLALCILCHYWQQKCHLQEQIMFPLFQWIHIKLKDVLSFQEPSFMNPINVLSMSSHSYWMTWVWQRFNHQDSVKPFWMCLFRCHRHFC